LDLGIFVECPLRAKTGPSSNVAFDPEQNSPPDNASIAERIQCRRRHRVESVGRRRPNCWLGRST
jgi:hypothetical protein